MRKLREFRDVEPGELKFYADKIAILNPPLRQTQIDQVEIAGVHAEKISCKSSEENIVMLCIHGGGFAFGSPKTHRSLVSHLCQQTNGVAYVPDYALSPKHKYPVALDQCELVYDHLISEYPDAHIALIGDSAGGNLSAALTIRCLEAGKRIPDSLVLMSPWLDLRSDSTSVSTNLYEDSVFDQKDLMYYASMYCDEHEQSIPEVSPVLSNRLGQFPSTYIQVTKNEILYFDSVEFSEALKEQGAEVKLDVSDKLYHSWQMVPDYLKEAKDSLVQIGEFILEQARP